MESVNCSKRKKIGVIGLVVLLLVSLTINIVMIDRLGDVETQIVKINETRINLPPELQARIEKSLEESIAKIELSTAEKVAATTKELLDQATVSQKSIDTRFAEIATNSEKSLIAVTAQVAELSKQKIAGNEIAAEEAFKLALQYVEEKDFLNAKIYCFNAINHAPNRKQYFEELVKIQRSVNAEPTVNDLEQIRSVLELGLYQVDAKDIAAMQLILQNISDEINTTVTKIAIQRAKQDSENLQQLLSSVKTGTLSWENTLTAKDSDKLSTIQKRQTVLNELAANSDFIRQETAWLENEIRRTNALMEYVVAFAAITNYLTSAEKLLSNNSSEKQLPAISSMVQTANGILSQAWSFDLGHLPQDYTRNLEHLAQRVALIETNFNKIKSASALVKIQNIREKIAKVTSGTYTHRINTIQNYVREIIALLPEVYDLDSRRTIEREIDGYSKTISSFNIDRYKAYQIWAVERCNDAFKLYSSWKRVDEKDAMRVIDEHLIRTDTSLLTPEVMKLHQDVLSKQFAEMGWKKIAEYESKLATSKKKSLEDF